jgi:hypothetical protein
MSHEAEQTALPEPPQRDDGVRLPGVPLLHRLAVLVPGLAAGAIFALFVAGSMMPPGLRLADRFLVWASVMGGPIVGTAMGMAEFYPFIGLGWLGLFLVPAHPICPSVATGWVTAFGLALWFFAGFMAMMTAAWGA